MSFSDKTVAFQEWLLSSAFRISEKIEIADLREVGEGRAVVALKDIEEEEELFSIPRSALINADNCSLIEDHESLREELKGLDQWQALILAVLYEWKVKGKNSRWAPYLDILPINDKKNYQFNQLMYWDEAELGQLAPSYIVNRLGVDLAEQMFLKLKGLYSKYVGDVSQNEFNMIATLIMSYSFDVNKLNAAKHANGEDENENENEEEGDGDDEEDENLNDLNPIEQCKYLKSMVPFADTLNADTHGHNASLVYSADHLIMRSIKKISEGEQIYNSYSEHPNAELLRRYGYVEIDGSAHDFAEISQEHLKRFFETDSGPFEAVIESLKAIENEQGETFVLEFYDCFASGEVIFELTFIIQILDVVFKVHLKNNFIAESKPVRDRTIKRIYKKCYQLLESKKLTKGFLVAYKSILNSRISEYPMGLDKPEPTAARKLTRSDQARIVLKSEWNSLSSCVDVERVFLSGDDKYTTIDDEKLLKNILKGDSAVNESSHLRKKQKRV